MYTSIQTYIITNHKHPKYISYGLKPIFCPRSYSLAYYDQSPSCDLWGWGGVFHTGMSSRKACSEDAASMPYLSGLRTWPTLALSPAFNASVGEYYARVPYDVYLLRVWAWVQSCYSEARMDDKYGLSRSDAYSPL